MYLLTLLTAVKLNLLLDPCILGSNCYLHNLVICWVSITVSEADHNTLITGVGLLD